MSQFYNPKRTKNLFNPQSKEPFRLSRTRIELFLNCKRCFYLDLRLGTARPPGFPFSLNAAVDNLLKKEFDIHRARGTSHPLAEKYNIAAVPFQHEKIGEWRNTLKGIRYLHQPTNMVITGGIDDVWVNPAGELIVVDYKATSKSGQVSIDADWQEGYRKQVEVYQWLFKKNGFKVSDTAYFVYCNGKTDKEAFDGKLEFDINILPYKGDTAWVEETIISARKCLMADAIPPSSKDCDYCGYHNAVLNTDPQNIDNYR